MDIRTGLLDKPLYLHVLFWCIVLTCYSVSNWDFFQGLNEVLVTYTVKVGLQAIVAYVILGIILPRYLVDRSILSLVLKTLVLLFFLNIAVTSWRQLYLIPTFHVTYIECIEKYGHLSFWQHLFSFQTIVFKNAATYLPPTLILIAFQYYDTLYKSASLSDLKKTQELDSLKKQLNPHFLFNTLNNLYALSLQKSEKTPEIIARLSEIMDYMLYRCEDDYVPLDNEVKLIENYLALENIRYGSRVEVDFNSRIRGNTKIAPLLLLTFIENAFKHGVSQETDKATISITLLAEEEKIDFCIRNSKPKKNDQGSITRRSIGLNNIKTQLQYLYKDAHELLFNENDNYYQIQLKIYHT